MNTNEKIAAVERVIVECARGAGLEVLWRGAYDGPLMAHSHDTDEMFARFSARFRPQCIAPLPAMRPLVELRLSGIELHEMSEADLSRVVGERIADAKREMVAQLRKVADELEAR